MQKKTRSYLVRLYDLTTAVRFPYNGGTSQSRTAASALSYEQDMRQFLPAYKKALLAILVASRPHEEDELEHSPEVLLSALEAWVQRREEADWQGKPAVLQDILDSLTD